MGCFQGLPSLFLKLIYKVLLNDQLTTDESIRQHFINIYDIGAITKSDSATFQHKQFHLGVNYFSFSVCSLPLFSPLFVEQTLRQNTHTHTHTQSCWM